MNSLLLVIDLQESFINEHTNHVLNKINDLINEKKFNKVVFTRFINSYESIWFKKLDYQDCLTEESKKILIDTKDNKVIDKKIYSALGEELINYINDNNISKIYLCGIDTECCILKTALDLFENEYDVYILKDYCACMNGEERHNNALDILKRTIGPNQIILKKYIIDERK